jgi:RNA-directed DNA polymerase
MLGSDRNYPFSVRKLNLFSWNRLEELLGTDRAHLRALANCAGRHYFPFPKAPKVRPFARVLKPPKLRIIDNPSDDLKAVQSLIAQRLLQPVKLPNHIFGGIKGKSVLDNVVFHRDSRVLLKMDLARFFPTITNRHIYQVWNEVLGCSPRISALLTRLTTFERHLPQGSPTSTMLANFVLHAFDGPFRSGCDRLGIRYSSWVDDLAFSSDNPRPIIGTVISTLRKGGFRISRKKLEITGPGARKILNGVVVGPSSLGVPPERLARIRSGIHKLRMGAVSTADVPRYLQRLRGSIAQLATINAKRARRFRKDLEAACDANRLSIIAAKVSQGTSKSLLSTQRIIQPLQPMPSLRDE